MITFNLYNNGAVSDITVENTAFSGVKKIANKVCKDIMMVTGCTPELNIVDEVDLNKASIIVATVGCSKVLSELELKGFIDLSKIEGKRECFIFEVVEIENTSKLIIVGSDKRGTIYGLFHISELMEVSPWVTFSDVVPKKKDSVVFTKKDNMISREPSVKFRGFFINDEWPAFGNWTFKHFGGFTAKMYDILFETLLRLKGNYLWPAMWTSSFSLDGPGDANAILADEYGIVMSNSHHEPCLRHSEEWDIVRGVDTIYGNEWNYYTNKEGLLNYWRDGLKRNGALENIITIGMRGERDSSMLGPDATLTENIELLKDIIVNQRRLIEEYVPNGDKAPMMIALYKEVERYFYGNEGKHDGLRDWDGLDGVTFMLCEDNFGNMRTLPTKELRDRDGGWGMYYHFDYHGGPISYEWVNSSYLPKVWDQMTKAYEFGIRDIWIVNVGDLKFNEYPLSYFMDLAYDYDKWGVSNLNSPEEYLHKFVKREFGHYFDEDGLKKITHVYKTYTKLNHNRKPEAMGTEIYSPVHYDEAGRMLKVIYEAEAELMECLEHVDEVNEAAFWELLYYPAMGSLNVQKWNLYGGLNHFFAKYGAVYANELADRMKACKRRDAELTEYFHNLLDGKWYGMALSKHVGFTNWNDEECRYPVMNYVDPMDGEHLIVLAKGEGNVVTEGGDWTRRTVVMNSFMNPEVNEATLCIYNCGSKTTKYEIVNNCDFISFSKTSGQVPVLDEVTVKVDKEKLRELAKVDPSVLDKLTFEVKYPAKRVVVKLNAFVGELPNCDKNTFVETNGIVSIEAEHFASKACGKLGDFEVINEYGKTLSGVKAFPINGEFGETCGPTLTYKVFVNNAGVYDFYAYCAPVNPHYAEHDVCFGLEFGDKVENLSLIPNNYNAGEPSCPSWAIMVLNQIRMACTKVTLKEGLNTIVIKAIDPGFLLEKLVLVKDNVKLPESYLGPCETYFVK